MVSVLDFVAIFVILKYWVPAEQYGIATKAVWIFPILDLLTDLGMSSAVIRQKLDREIVSTVFWLNLISATVLFGLLLVLAPIVALRFYGHVIVGQLVIAYGCKLLWQNVYFIPIAMMKREFRFKEISVARILGNLAEFGVKIGTAALGFGVWCFVTGSLARVLVVGILAQVNHPWWPAWTFRPRQAWHHLKFALQTSSSQLLFQFYSNIDYPIVGYFFGDKILGMYKLAYEIVLEPVRVIAGVVTDVAFTTFAKLRHAPGLLVTQFISFTKLNLISVTTYVGVVFIAADDVVSCFNPSFAGTGAAVRILCLVALLRSLSYIMPPLLDGTGRSVQTLRYMATAAVVLPLLYLGVSRYFPQLGLLAVPLAWAIGYPIAFAVIVGMSLRALAMTPRAYFASIRGLLFSTLAPIAVGFALHAAFPWQSPLLRLGLTAAAVVSLTMYLLHRLQGINLATATRALKG